METRIKQQLDNNKAIIFESKILHEIDYDELGGVKSAIKSF